MSGGRFELLVVGGGPAGLAAVRGFRESGGSGPVALVADEHRMPYRRPPLTKELLRGEIDEAELALEDDSWPAAHGVAIVYGRAVALEPARRTVVLSGARQLSWERCVLATGGEPARLQVPGVDDPAVLVLRSLDHLRELERRLAAGGPVVVVGSGFIACEVAASLRARGLEVTIVSAEAAPNVERLGEAAAAEIARWLDEDGVTLDLSAPLQAVEREGRRLWVRSPHVAHPAALVIMAAGIRPRAELALGAGLTLDDGAVAVDERMRTGVPGVLAAGDVCRARNAAAGRRLRVEHWGDALAQGWVAGATAAGADAVWDEVPGFWTTIGRRTLKYAAWGDGFEEAHVRRPPGGGLVVTYAREGRVVGVLAHECDEAYERGRELIARGAPVAEALEAVWVA